MVGVAGLAEAAPHIVGKGRRNGARVLRPSPPLDAVLDPVVISTFAASRRVACGGSKGRRRLGTTQPCPTGLEQVQLSVPAGFGAHARHELAHGAGGEERQQAIAGPQALPVVVLMPARSGTLTGGAAVQGAERLTRLPAFGGGSFVAGSVVVALVRLLLLRALAFAFSLALAFSLPLAFSLSLSHPASDLLPRGFAFAFAAALALSFALAHRPTAPIFGVV